MIVASHARPGDLAHGHQRIGKVSAWVHREFTRRFMQVAADIGLDPMSAEL